MSKLSIEAVLFCRREKKIDNCIANKNSTKRQRLRLSKANWLIRKRTYKATSHRSQCEQLAELKF